MRAGLGNEITFGAISILGRDWSLKPASSPDTLLDNGKCFLQKARKLRQLDSWQCKNSTLGVFSACLLGTSVIGPQRKGHDKEAERKVGPMLGCMLFSDIARLMHFCPLHSAQ